MTKMAAVLLNLGRTLQIAEEQFLQAAGFAVKNTFIDEASPLPLPEEESHRLRRAVTAPLPKCQCEDFLFKGEDAMQAMSPTSTESTVADSDSDASDFESTHSREALLVLLESECTFLRIASMALLHQDESQGVKLPVKGVTQCLRVCVHGLPSKKRNKWQNPLAWCVAVALQRAGCPAVVKRSQLFAPLDGCSTSQSELVRVDLCAPRFEEL